MAAISTLHFQFVSFPLQPSIWVSNHRTPSFGSRSGRPSWAGLQSRRRFVLRALDGGGSDGIAPENEVVKSENKYTINLKDPVGKLHGVISSFTPFVFTIRQQVGSNLAIGLCVATAFLVVAVRLYVVRKSKYDRPGSVADLVRRGQLRSDRRGISKPLKYDDPFNNPLVKIGKGNSTVEMCGKVYRLAPVTLTEEQRVIHQKRRSRAYHWKRPTTFLKEGELVPHDVDPDTVRWIPANHPFATTADDIDEGLAQNNVYQKHGVPFRIQAEHEALHREQKITRLVDDSSNAKDFSTAFWSTPKSPENGEENPISNQATHPKPPSSQRTPNSSEEIND